VKKCALFIILLSIGIILISGCDRRGEKISSTSQTSKTVTKEDSVIVRIRNIKDEIPQEILSTNFKELSGNLILDNFFDKCLGDLPRYLQSVNDSKVIARAANFKIRLVLDEHAHLGGQSEASSKRQSEISALIKKDNPGLVFVEGMQFSGSRITRASVLDELQNTFRLNGKSPSEAASISESIILHNKLKFWYYDLLDTKIKLFAIDQIGINQLVLMLDMIQRSDYTQNLDVRFLNFYIRENIILSNIVQIMKKENQQEGVLVIGGAHQKYFPDLCRDWGIACEIITR